MTGGAVSAHGLRLRSSMCIFLSFGHAAPIHPHSTPFLMPAGRPTTSSRCRNSSLSWPSRFAPSAACVRWPPRPRARERRNNMPHTVIPHADNKEPTAFTQKELGWLPWLDPLAEGDFTERHRTALVDATRIKSPYFRLLARAPDIL